MSSRHLSIALFVLLAGLLGLHAWHYFPFFSDRAFVSLRYAMRFANGEGLTWSDGERVEGYPGFFWVVLNGCASRLGFGLVPSARVLAFAGVLLAVAAMGLEPRGRGVSLERLGVGGALIVATSPFAIWAIGGLEQGLLAGLLALSLRLLERSATIVNARRVWRFGIPLALVTLVRADGVVLALALLLGSACLPRPSMASLRRAAVTAVPSAMALVASVVFRLAYYGQWLPSSVRARLSFTSEGLGAGLAYAGGGYASSGMLVLLALAATAFSLRRGEKRSLFLPGAMLFSWTAYVVLLGGDDLPGFRELVPGLLALCFVVADEVAADWPRIISQRVLVLPILALCVFLHLTQSTESAENRRAKAETWVWDDLAVGRTLKTAFAAKQPLLAVDGSAALAFSSELPSLDLAGVNSRELEDGRARRRPADLVAFRDVLGRTEPQESPARELYRSHDFLENYQSISVEGSARDAAVGEIWVRREQGKLGLVRTPDLIDVPGYLFSGRASRASSVLDRAGMLVAELSSAAPGVLPNLSVPLGRWRVEVASNDPALVIDVRCQGVSMQRIAPTSEPVFEVDGTTPVSIVAAPAPGARSTKLRRAALTRVSDSPAAFRCAPLGSPLRVSAASLAVAKSKRTFWEHPSNVLFSTAGVLVELGWRASVQTVELSLSHNDAYVVELRRDRRVVWGTNIEGKRRAKRPALETHHFELPKVVDGGNFELFVKPRLGNTACSIGHVTLR